MSRPLNFLQLTTFYPPYSFGGDATYLYRLCHRLGDAGHEIDVVHCVDSFHLAHPAEPTATYDEHPNVRRHELRSKFRWLSPLLTQQTGRPWLKNKTISNLLSQKSYDVVHFHNTSLLGPKLLTAQTSRGNPIKLYTTHEHWLICPMHVLWKYDRQLCDKPTCLRCTIQGRRPPQLWRYTGLLERCSAHIDQFISPSKFTQQMHKDRGFDHPMEILPLFIDRVDDDWQSPGERPNEKPYFLFVGRLEKIKGLQSVIAVWDQVKDADLLIAGTGSYEAELKQMAAAKRSIKFLGRIPQDNLGQYYFHALATIVPSLTYETFGMINIESFARKTPVIARELGALTEIVNDSNGGLLFRSAEELLKCIKKIQDSQKLRDELGENGYRVFIRNWSTEAHLKSYFSLIESTTRDKFGRVPWEADVK